MKLPRILSALALGLALLAFAPLAGAQTVKITTLTDASVEKLGKFFDAMNADPDANPEFQNLGKDEEIGNAVKEGKSVNDAVNSKYPKTAAALKKVGYTPDDFFASFFSLVMAASGATDGVSDPAVAKANITYFGANSDKIAAVMAKMK